MPLLLPSAIEAVIARLAVQVRTADQHDSLKRVIRDMRLALESRFKLGAIQVGRGCCYAATFGDVRLPAAAAAAAAANANANANAAAGKVAADPSACLVCCCKGST